MRNFIHEEMYENVHDKLFLSVFTLIMRVQSYEKRKNIVPITKLNVKIKKSNQALEIKLERKAELEKLLGAVMR